jgi:hypothetical protein
MLGPIAVMVPTIGKTGQAFMFRDVGKTPTSRTRNEPHWFGEPSQWLFRGLRRGLY